MAVAAAEFPAALDQRRPEREVGVPPTDDKALYAGAIDAYKKAWAKYIIEGHRHAKSVNSVAHERFRRFRQRRTARYGTRVNGNRLYRAMITKLIGTMKANIIPELISNPFTMDWLEMESHAPGFEPFFRDVQAVVRHKFATARPATDGTFLETVDAHVDDFLTYGSTIGIVTQEILEGDLNGDGIISQQPMPERISVFDFFPWSISVDSIARSASTIWSPITEDELDDTQYIDAAYIRSKVKVLKAREESTEAGGQRILDSDLWPDVSSFEGLYPSLLYHGGCPWRKIVDLVDDPQIKEDLQAAGKEGMYEALAIEYGFDPLKAASARWWCGRVIGEELGYAKPWPIALPQEHSPIIFEKYIKVPGQLWGMGLYDLGETDEESHNRMNVAGIKMSEMAANPPTWYHKNSIDQVWLQEQGGFFQLRPGLQIPVNDLMEKQPIEVMSLPLEVLPGIIQQSGMYEGQLRTLVGVGSDIEGQSEARTATQNVNNVQFGLAWMTYTIARLRGGLMLQYAVRSYLALRQSMQEMDSYIQGIYEIAPTGYIEGRMRTAAITAQHMIDLNWVSIRVTGPNQDSSRVASIQQKITAYQAFVQSQPLYNSHEGMLDIYRTMRVHDYRKFSLAYGNASQMEIASSIAASGMTLPPEYQMELGIAPMMPPAPEPMPGEDGEEPPTGDSSVNVEGAPEPPQLPNDPGKNYRTRTFKKAVGAPATV